MQSTCDQNGRLRPGFAKIFFRGGRAHRALSGFLQRAHSDGLTFVLVITGKGSMPKSLRTDEEVIAYVAKTRGAIGYAASTASLDGKP